MTTIPYYMTLDTKGNEVLNGGARVMELSKVEEKP